MLNTENVAAEVPDDITRDYQETLAVIHTLEKKSAWWTETMNSHWWKQFTDDKQAEADRKSAAWRSPSFKPKDFAVEQPRVIAVDEVIQSFTDYAFDVRTELSNARAKKAHMEDQYGALLYGQNTPEKMRLADVQDVPGAGGDLFAAQQVTLHVVTVPLDKKVKEHRKVEKKLEAAGYSYTVVDDSPVSDEWHWQAPETTKSGEVYDEMLTVDGAIVARCWAVDPAQIEIPVDGPEVVDGPGLDGDGVPEYTGEELPTCSEEAHTPATASECVIITSHIASDLESSRLLQVLAAGGFSCLSVSEMADRDEWVAPWSEVAWDAMSAMDDDRILEKKVR